MAPRTIPLHPMPERVFFAWDAPRPRRIGVRTWAVATDTRLHWVSRLEKTLFQTFAILGPFVRPGKRHLVNREPRLDAQTFRRLRLGFLEPSQLSVGGGQPVVA